jgi:hypothetical protein
MTLSTKNYFWNEVTEKALRIFQAERVADIRNSSHIAVYILYEAGTFE